MENLIFTSDYFFNQSDKYTYIQTIELYKAFTRLTNTHYLIYHSLSYPICPTMTFLYHLSDHNYITPLIESRFSYSDYDWSISLVPKWFNYTTCPFMIYLSPFVSIIFSLFLFFSLCLIITTPIQIISLYLTISNWWKQIKKFLFTIRN